MVQFSDPKLGPASVAGTHGYMHIEDARERLPGR